MRSSMFNKKRWSGKELRDTPAAAIDGFKVSSPSPRRFGRLGSCVEFLVWDSKHRSSDACEDLECEPLSANLIKAAYEIWPSSCAILRVSATVGILEMHVTKEAMLLRV